MNRDERISVPRITLRNVVVPKTPMVNIFGVTDRFLYMMRDRPSIIVVP